MPWEDCLKTAPQQTVADVPTISCLEPLFANIVSVITIFAGIVLFVILIVGGYKYLSSGGDPKKTAEARGTLTAAFIGFVLIIAAYLILSVIARFIGGDTGADLLRFRITFPSIIPIE